MSDEEIICGMTKKERQEIIDLIDEMGKFAEIEISLIGDTNESIAYAPSIVGISIDRTQVIYDRELLIRCYMEYNKCSLEDAEDWVSYNIENSLRNICQPPVLIEKIDLFM